MRTMEKDYRGPKKSTWVKHRFKVYGTTEEAVRKMWESQGCRCAICLQPVPCPFSPKSAIDHNHDTGKVRGVLCQTCNCGIGLLKDNPTIIARAAQYLFDRL